MMMMVVKVVLSFLILATITEAARPPVPAPAPAPVVDFDYLQLVQSWPPSVCDVSNCSISNYPERFTIHGLWPEKIGSTVKNCTGEPFNKTKIESLIPLMETHWITLVKKTNLALWRHEWNKHGKCSGLGIVEYFNVTLREYMKFDLTLALESQSIIPGGRSTPETISRAIKAQTRFVPILSCKTGKTKGEVLYEVSLCYNKAATAIQDCTDKPIRFCDVAFPQKK